MPPPLSASDVYAADRAGDLSPAVRGDRALVYVPNSQSTTVTVIDQASMRLIDTFPVGVEPEHVVPAYDLRTLYVVADRDRAALRRSIRGRTLTPRVPSGMTPSS